MPKLVNTALYPCAVLKSGDDTIWRIVVPDLPGCDVTGATYWQTKELAYAATASWIADAHRTRRAIPPPSPMSNVIQFMGYEGWDLRWLSVVIDPPRG